MKLDSVKIAYTVGCPSGLRGQFAKLLARKGHTGSNPVPTAQGEVA